MIEMELLDGQIAKDIAIIKKGKRKKCKICRNKKYLLRPVIVQRVPEGDQKRLIVCFICKNAIETHKMKEYILVREDVRLNNVDSPNI